MKISVVTVCFNSADTIAETLDSVAAQSHPDVEHIVVDGASRDDTLRVVGEHGERVERIVSEPDRGIYDAMNKGLKLATGEVIAFLNADDVYADDEVLERVAGVFASPSVDAAYGGLVLLSADESGKVLRYWQADPEDAASRSPLWTPPHPALFVRRRAYRRVGDFDASLRIAADLDMSIRLFWKARCTARRLPGIVVRMRAGGASTRSWRSVVAGNLEVLQVCRRHGLRWAPWLVVRKLLSKVPQLVFRP